MSMPGGDVPIIVEVMVPDRDTAKRMAAAVVGSRLAACANIGGTVDSLYHWQGKIEHGQETVLFFKTLRKHFDALSEQIRALHSYDCPCIIAMPITDGTADYLDWIKAETRAGSDR